MMNKALRSYLKNILRSTGFELRRARPLGDPVMLAQKKALYGVDVRNIVDIGANHGETVESYCQGWPNATVHAFEPHPQICVQLKKRFGGNCRVKINCQAIGDVTGIVELKMSSSPSMHSIVGLTGKTSPYLPQSVEYSESIKVPVSTLDEVCVEHDIDRIDIMKVDVEGFEKQVLFGGRSSLESGIVRLICIEVMFVEHFESQWLFRDINNYLESKKYILFDIPLIKKASNGRARWGNAIYVSAQHEITMAEQLVISN